ESSPDLPAQIVVPPIIEKQCLGAALAFIIAGSWPNRIDVTPIVLRLGVDIWFTIDFGCRCLNHLRLHSLRQTEHINGTVHTGLGGLHRIALIVNWRGRASDVENFIDLDVERKCHVMTLQFEMLLVEKVLDIFPGAS